MSRLALAKSQINRILHAEQHQLNFFGPAYSAEAATWLLNELSGNGNSEGLQNHVTGPVSAW